MRYIDVERLDAIDPVAFQSQKPYPWINPEKLLTGEGYAHLLKALPDVSLFTAHFGRQRRQGQYSHDRFALEYYENLNIAQPWKEFIGELHGNEYQSWIR